MLSFNVSKFSYSYLANTILASYLPSYLNLNKVGIAIPDTLYKNNYTYATKKFMYNKSYSAVVYECMNKTN